MFSLSDSTCPEFYSCTPQYARRGTLRRALLQPAQDEGEQKPGGSDDAYNLAALLMNLEHHRARQHRQDSSGGEGLNSGDQVLRSSREKEIAEERGGRRGNRDSAPERQDVRAIERPARFIPEAE